MFTQPSIGLGTLKVQSFQLRINAFLWQQSVDNFGQSSRKCEYFAEQRTFLSFVLRFCHIFNNNIIIFNNNNIIIARVCHIYMSYEELALEKASLSIGDVLIHVWLRISSIRMKSPIADEDNYAVHDSMLT